VTKLAAEHLCALYARTDGIPVVALRYFTVYGPRQRPDMAIHRLIEAAITGTTFSMFGGGEQVRDFTHVDDVVNANLLAASADVPPGAVINVSGGSAASLRETIDIVGELMGRPVSVQTLPAARGDVDRTGGATDLAHELLDWKPRVDLRRGLAGQLAWHLARATSIANSGQASVR
jgi:UDP-glucuronate 4-epimerase